MHAYSIPKGYMHKYGGDVVWKARSKGFPNMHGVFLAYKEVLDDI